MLLLLAKTERERHEERQLDIKRETLKRGKESERVVKRNRERETKRVRERERKRDIKRKRDIEKERHREREA